MANPKYLLNKTGSEVDNILSSAESHVVDDSKHITSEEKTKLAGIESGANKTTVDAALDTKSTNPVQNKAITNWLAENVKNYSLAKDSNNNVYLSSSDISTYATSDPDVSDKVNELVEGIVIGKVEKVVEDKNNSLKYVIVKPNVDFKNIDDVVIVEPRNIK